MQNRTQWFTALPADWPVADEVLVVRMARVRMARVMMARVRMG